MSSHIGRFVLFIGLIAGAMIAQAGAQTLRVPVLFAQEPATSPPQEQTPPVPGQTAPNTQPAKLNINVTEGAGAVNNVRTRAAREFTVEVDDEADRPVPGAVVTFVAPSDGPGGAFSGDTQLLTVMTDKDGRAVASSYRPNSTVGDYNIQVTATLGDLTATATISQSNRALAVTGAKGKSNKKILILVAVGAAVAAGAAAGLGGHGSSSSSSSASSTTTSATLGLGSGVTVGAPH